MENHVPWNIPYHPRAVSGKAARASLTTGARHSRAWPALIFFASPLPRVYTIQYRIASRSISVRQVEPGLRFKDASLGTRLLAIAATVPLLVAGAGVWSVAALYRVVPGGVDSDVITVLGLTGARR